MTANEIRQAFFDFFTSKDHQIVSSAPLVMKNDPSLMFTNAGMNQFKDIFLDYQEAQHPRVANTQKCLRVSGKHNDLEEVGHDTYHHTMFEMLGNWSFGDYFKKEAIAWAWEFLTQRMNIPGDRLYATIFEGDAEDKLDRDKEAYTHWAGILDRERILDGSKKDNFWEMGETGPCGPCSEIHVDLRSDEEREKIPGRELVNKDHPEVIEIWNLVFMQYNRRANGSLVPLPKKHVDTGMGFERLCRVIQNKKSNYDIDLFQDIILEISKNTGKKYGRNEDLDVAFRVIADHLRAVSFSIADGQLPSNNKAGYVIRRILRRAIRYGFTFFNLNEPFLCALVPVLVEKMKDAFPELESQQQLIEKVIREEEASFLRTLETGLQKLDGIIRETMGEGYQVVSGKIAFELYDTYGFPLDLTELILREKDLVINRRDFEQEMKNQKERSRRAGSLETGDWVVLRHDDVEEFIGYERLEEKIYITRYRQVKSKGKDLYELVFNITPFYAEAGGQVGDTGYIEANGERVDIINTLKTNNLIIHLSKKLPSDPGVKFHAVVNSRKRRNIANNHTATHLMHHALREILGSHVEQKGSLVDSDYLRFDFSHYQKVGREEVRQVETMVNRMIRANHPRKEYRDITMEKAREMGALALFGEKYGDLVRVIRFGETVELCGGTHVEATGSIGYFKITTETAVAAGIRRMEAVTGEKAHQHIQQQTETLEDIENLFKGSRNAFESVAQLLKDHGSLQKTVEHFQNEMARIIRKDLLNKKREIQGLQLITEEISAGSPELLKRIAFSIKQSEKNLVLALGAEINGKAHLQVMISDDLVKERQLHAGKIIREIAQKIQGGGGGQPFMASAGGQDPTGIGNALAALREMLEKL